MSGRRASRWTVEFGLFAVNVGLAKGDAVAGLVESDGERLDLSAGGGQSGLLGLSALQAGELFVFKALDFGLCKAKFVLDGVGLLGSGDRVLLDRGSGWPFGGEWRSRGRGGCGASLRG